MARFCDEVVFYFVCFFQTDTRFAHFLLVDVAEVDVGHDLCVELEQGNFAVRKDVMLFYGVEADKAQAGIFVYHRDRHQTFYPLRFERHLHNARLSIERGYIRNADNASLLVSFHPVWCAVDGKVF